MMYNKTESEISLANKMKQNCDTTDPALSHNSKVTTTITTNTNKVIIVFYFLF